jgi:2-C-methyl-D-erythritol 4-phosphate cytidylyltransferase
VSVWAIVVAAGEGRRFGSAKQFELIGGETVLDRSVRTAAETADGVVVVLPGTRDVIDWEPPPGIDVALGGETRADSVRSGLAFVPDAAEIVVVHDAARPMASADLFRAVLDAVRAGADGAVPGVTIRDTVKRVQGAVVSATVPREELVAVQTPQAFRADVLRAAHRGEPDATDDAALVEAAGGRVVVVPGEEANIKITVPDDLDAARARAAT